MTIFGTEIRYGLVAQAIHWATAGLVLGAWLVSGNRETMTLHQTFGFAVFVLVIVRLVWRAFDKRPAHPPMPGLMSFASRVVQWLLYALLIAVPASAITGSWLQGRSITVYGLGAIGPYLTTSRDIGHQILDIHETLGTTILWVAGLHAAAAIFHHVFLKDRVLRQMLPVG